MIKKIFKAKSWLDVIKHLFLAVFFFSLLLVLVFFVYLPYITNQDDSITVPEVVGMEYDGLDEFITSKALNYVVTPDSGYNADLPPKAVLTQFPKPFSQVKEGRKLYLTLNAVNPPKVEMPDLVGKSLQTVLLKFNALGLKKGKYNFTPGPYKNTFVAAQIKGNTVEPGELVAKGSVVDLLLQNGRGKQYFNAPDVIGKDKERAEFIIAGSSLNIGEILYEKTDSLQGKVIKQLPNPGSRVRIGQLVNLWVGVKDSLATGEPSILNADNE